jgi:hypothetical protein
MNIRTTLPLATGTLSFLIVEVNEQRKPAQRDMHHTINLQYQGE